MIAQKLSLNLHERALYRHEYQPQNHTYRHGRFLCLYRTARQSRAERKAHSCRPCRKAWCSGDGKLRSTQIRSTLCHVVRQSTETLPATDFVPGRMEVYKQVSAQIHDIFHEYTDIIEPISLDEAFLDVTENKKGIELAVDIAREIKQRIREELHLIASAGVSYNKFLAKIASDLRKPDGLCTIHPDQAEEFIAGLPIEAFWGIGPVTAQKMHTLGIYNGTTLRNCSLDMLTRQFGKAGKIYYDFARGIDLRPVEAVRIRKSIGCEHTLEKDITLKSSVIIELYHVACELAERLKAKNFRGSTLTLKVKFYDFTQITRSISVNRNLYQLKEILPLAKELINQVDFQQRPIRLLGLSVSNPKEEQEVYAPQWIQLELKFTD